MVDLIQTRSHVLGSGLPVRFGFGGVSCVLPAEGARSQDPAVTAHLWRISSSVADLGRLPAGHQLLDSHCSYTPVAWSLSLLD